MEGLTYVRDTETPSLDFLRKDLFSSHSQKEELPSLPSSGFGSRARVTAEWKTGSGQAARNPPRAESFLVLMILAAYSWPASTFTHLRTTEKAPLEDREQHGTGRSLRPVSTGYQEPLQLNCERSETPSLEPSMSRELQGLAYSSIGQEDPERGPDPWSHAR